MIKLSVIFIEKFGGIKRSLEDFNYKIVTLGILVFISSNCAPVASDMQSAKLLGKGGLDITLNRGNLEYKGTFESEIGSGEYEEFNHVQEKLWSSSWFWFN